MLLQPVDAFGIQMVGRLVEQQHVRFLQQEAAKCHASAFSSRKVFHRLVGRWTAQSIHGTFQFAVQIPSIRSVDDVLQFPLTGKQGIHLIFILVIFRKTEFLVDFFIFRQGIHDRLHTLHDHFLHGLGRIQLRFLRQISHAVPRREYHFALEILVQSCDNFHQGGFSGTVQTDDADFSPIEETQVDVLQHLFVGLADGLTHADHGENDFLVVYCCHKLFFVFMELNE